MAHYWGGYHCAWGNLLARSGGERERVNIPVHQHRGREGIRRGIGHSAGRRDTSLRCHRLIESRRLKDCMFDPADVTVKLLEIAALADSLVTAAVEAIRLIVSEKLSVMALPAPTTVIVILAALVPNELPSADP